MTDSAIKYVGVDDCKAGWIGVGLDDGDGWEIKVCGKFCDLLVHFGDACIVLVDMPIGLHEDGKPSFRACDIEARGLLEQRKFSVFPTPSRRLLDKVMAEEWVREDASEWSRKEWGRKIGVQEFGIYRKMHEVSEALELRGENASLNVRESHPEFCFLALSEKQRPMSHKKRDRVGRDERLAVLRHRAQDVNSIDVDEIFNEARRKYARSQVANDDILDALALAITAKIVWQNCERFGTLPENAPPDSVGEMVYAKS